MIYEMYSKNKNVSLELGTLNLKHWLPLICDTKLTPRKHSVNTPTK